MARNRLRENEHYVRLLLSTTPSQQKALLDSVTDEQLDLLTEVLYNLLYVVPINQRERSAMLRKQAWKELAKISRSRKYRRVRVKANRKRLLDILIKYSKELITMLNES